MVKKTTVFIILFATSFHLFSQNTLFIPPLDSGVWVNGVRTFNLIMRNDSTQFLSGKKTPTSGYNGSFLGPTLFIKKGDSVQIKVTNNLGENSSTHWHGLHVPSKMDGGPHQIIANGANWTASFEMRNEASTFWYHPHHKPNFWRDANGTGGQVYRGLVGMMIVKDANSDTLSIPNTYGIDEIPLIIQDRAFDANNEFIEFLNPALAGRPGDTILVNGTLNAQHNTHAQKIRYRILNGSNTRTYYLGFSDNRNFQIIGTDGGFLNNPITLNRIRLSPAERVEIIVDFSGDQGNIVTLKSYASELNSFMPVFVPNLLDDLDTTDYNLMTFNIGAPTTSPAPITTISSTLNQIVNYDTLLADVKRSFILSNGPPMTINGVSMDLNVINEVIRVGDMELWTIRNESGSSHPFHIHGEPFQVVARSNGPVEAWEKGWKDVVFVSLRSSINNAGWVKIIKPFNDFTDSVNPFMYHCHILEHEDRGMMGQYIVVDQNFVGLEEVSTNSEIIVSLYPNPINDLKINLDITSSKKGSFKVVLMNIQGKEIQVLANNKTLVQGKNKFSYTLREISSGIYFIKIYGEQSVMIKKLLKL